MRYILLGSDAPKVYIKDCKESISEICFTKETDFLRTELFCVSCLYYNICCLLQKKNL